MRLKTLVVLVAAGAIAVAGAGWKWHAVKSGHANYQIAGWSWGEGRAPLLENTDD